MSFWTYMLYCGDRSFYVGHTDDLEGRIALHARGGASDYPSRRLPVRLIWSQEFGSRIEAIAAERQIKGWNRAKKLALIRGDWDLISSLAQSRQDQ